MTITLKDLKEMSAIIEDIRELLIVMNLCDGDQVKGYPSDISITVYNYSYPVTQEGIYGGKHLYDGIRSYLNDMLEDKKQKLESYGFDASTLTKETLNIDTSIL